ncbi:TetR family transcriptional regulator [Burkholderia sp. TJI49]|nr:TetR family transcriptional regulator [Burkholderia sp. TJI49]
MATDMLSEEGYGELTMRKVANAAGISLSNLQFHFKTREDLLGAVITQLTSAYLEQFEAIERDTRLDPVERLEAVLRNSVAEVKKPRVQSVFFNIWALAQTQDFAREIVDRIYKAQRAVFARFIAQINPGLTAHECMLRAALISCQVEGLMILIPQRTTFVRDLRGIEAELMRAVMSLAKAPSNVAPSRQVS